MQSGERGRRAGRLDVPALDSYFTRWSALHGGFDPSDSIWVRSWLRLGYLLARPLAQARVAPDAVTLSGLAVSAAACVPAAAGGRWLLLAGPVVALSGLADSLDGAVAILQHRTTRWGYVLDSVVDRVSDVLNVTALWLAGAPAGVVVTGGVLAFLVEYARARAAVAGMTEIAVVTVWERATRVTVTALFLISGGLYAESSRMWAGLGGWAWLGLGVVGLGQLLVVVRRRLG